MFDQTQWAFGATLLAWGALASAWGCDCKAHDIEAGRLDIEVGADSLVLVRGLVVKRDAIDRAHSGLVKSSRPRILRGEPAFRVSIRRPWIPSWLQGQFLRDEYIRLSRYDDPDTLASALCTFLDSKLSR